MEKDDKFVELFDLEKNKKLNLTPYTYAIQQYTLSYNIRLTRYIFFKLKEQISSFDTDKEIILNNAIEFINFTKKLLIHKPMYNREYYPVQDMMVSAYYNVAFLDKNNKVKNKLVKSLKHIALNLKVNNKYLIYKQERFDSAVNLLNQIQNTSHSQETKNK